MILEVLGSAALGAALAWAAALRLAHRLPRRPLVFATGSAGALFGDFVAHSALGPSLLLSLLGAAVVSAASLSLLLRPSGGLRRRSAPA